EVRNVAQVAAIRGRERREELARGEAERGFRWAIEQLRRSGATAAEHRTHPGAESRAPERGAAESDHGRAQLLGQQAYAERVAQQQRTARGPEAQLEQRFQHGLRVGAI